MFPFRLLAFVTARVGFAEDRREGFREAWAQLFVVGDVEPCVEGLVREPPVRVARVRVSTMRVSEEPERVVKEGTASGVVLAVLGEATVHVGKAGADAVLVPLQRGQVDGVGEVRGQQLVGLRFQPCPVRSQVSQFLILARVALVERCIDVGGESLVGGVADRDSGVGVRDKAFRDSYRNRPAGAVRLLRGTARAHEVGIGGAARVGGEVQQHPRPTSAAVQEPFEMVGVLDMPGHLRAAGVQERLHLIEQCRVDERFVRAGMQGAFVADDTGVVGVGEELVEGVLPQRLRRSLRRRHGQQPACGEVAE